VNGRDHGRANEYFLQDFSPWERPHAGAGEQGEKAEAAEMSCYQLITTPTPHSPVPLRARGGEQAEDLGMRE